MSDAVFLSLLNRTYYVAGKRRVPDGRGGWLVSFYDKGTITGRLRPASSRERETARREERLISHVFYCVADEAVLRGDYLSPSTITIAADGFTLSSAEIIVEVDALREPSTWSKHWEIDCIERQFEAGGAEIIVFRLLLESGDQRLLESGGRRLLEA